MVLVYTPILCPSIFTSPLDCLNKPVKILIKVVLPLPLGPNIPTTLPDSIFRFKLSRAFLLK